MIIARVVVAPGIKFLVGEMIQEEGINKAARAFRA
jgi:hypothetical protein